MVYSNKSRRNRCSKKKYSNKRKNKSLRGGCNNCKITGGNNTYPSANVIPLNNYNMDPNNSNAIISSRLLPNIKGGKRNKLKLKNNKTIKGGGISDFFLGNNAATNQSLAFGSTSSSQSNANILSGVPFVNTSLLTRGNMFNTNNPPLV